MTAAPQPCDDRELAAGDLARLGALHVECIDDSLPALLGPRFAARLYAYLTRSQFEHVLWERVDGAIESAVVVSEAPGSLQARIARETLLHLLPAAIAALCTSTAFWRFLAGTLVHALRQQAEPGNAPEITYVFTNPQLQGRKLGKRLIERVDALLRSKGVDVYYVKTLDEPGNRAIAFYEREGFERIGTRDEAGRRFVEFRKRLG